MIPAGVQVFVALEPVDLRCGFERLAGLVQDRVGYEPRSGALFVFVGKRRLALKILFFDGTGLCLFHKRLDKGTFVWPGDPAPGTTHVEIDDAALQTLLDGLPLAPESKPPRRGKPRVH